MKPKFNPGKNIAIKTPAHEYNSVVDFYKEVLGFQKITSDSSDSFESVCFAFGDKVLWIDRIDGISQSEVWLEVTSNDVQVAREYLEREGCIIRGEIERLPDSLHGFWLSSPSNIIHLVTEI